MLIFLTTLLATLWSIFRSRASLGLENLGLRHQTHQACGRYSANAKGCRGVGCRQWNLLFVCAHTTAAVTINECADPDVSRDVEGAVDRLILTAGPYRHSEGNSDSHVKSVLVGASQIIYVDCGKLVLGRWQGVFFCEFDGPRVGRLQVKVVAD